MNVKTIAIIASATVAAAAVGYLAYRKCFKKEEAAPAAEAPKPEEKKEEKK